MNDSNQKTPRRGLLKLLGVTGAASLTALSGRSQAAEAPTGDDATYPRKLVGTLQDLEQKRSLAFSYPDEASSCVLAKLGRTVAGGTGPAEDIVGYSTICPHLGCPIEPKVDQRGILGPCRCHFSAFDLSEGGEVIQGPSTSGLAQVELQVMDDGRIFAIGMRGLVYGRHCNVERPDE